MKQFIRLETFTAALLLGLFQPVLATTVTYDVTNISGNTWEYSYTVANDSLSADIEEFTIFFDVSLYENLLSTTVLTDWDDLVIDPNPGIPEDGFFDALAFADGITPGNTLSGFSVQFDYLGTGVPGNQPFTVIDPLTFEELDTGFTQAVPLPAALWLFACGLLGLLGSSNFIRKQRCT